LRKDEQHARRPEDRQGEEGIEKEEMTHLAIECVLGEEDVCDSEVDFGVLRAMIRLLLQIGACFHFRCRNCRLLDLP
jgi:hypothetical protein